MRTTKDILADVTDDDTIAMNPPAAQARLSKLILEVLLDTRGDVKPSVVDKAKAAVRPAKSGGKKR